MKTCPRWCCSLSWSLATLCSYIKEQTKSKTKRHMLLVCNSAGSAFSYSCFCCSLSFLVSSLFLFFLYCSSISALMFVYHHCKILYILSLTGLYILLFLLPILNFLFFSVLFFFFNSVSIIFSLCFLLHFCFCLYYPQLFFHSSLYIVLNKESKRNNPPPPPKTGNFSAVSRPHFLLHFHVPCCFHKS